MADNCVSSFNDLKLKHDRKYIVYKMNDKMTQIEVFKEGAKDASYSEFRRASSIAPLAPFPRLPLPLYITLSLSLSLSIRHIFISCPRMLIPSRHRPRSTHTP